MATRIQIKRGAGAPPGFLSNGEPAFDTTGKVLYVGDGTSNWPFSTGGGGAGGGNFSAGGGSSSFATLVFTNGSGVSFSNSNGSLAATVRTDYASSNHSHGNPTLALTNLTGTTASASNGLTLSLSGPAPVTTNGLLSAVNLSAGATSANLSAVTFNNGGGVTFGLTNSVITASVNTNYAGSGFTSAGANISLSGTLNSNGLSLSASVTVPTVTNSSWTVSDAATSATVGRLAFTNANGMTLSLSTSNNGNHTVVGSYTVPTVTNSSMTVSDAGTSGTLARLAFTNLNGITLSLSTGAGGSHTIVGSIASTYAGTGFTSAGANISLSGTLNSAGLSLSASVAAAGAGGGVALYDGVNSISSGTARFTNANGVTFSINGQTISASVVAPVTFSTWRPMSQWGLSTVAQQKIIVSTQTPDVFPFNLPVYVSVGVAEFWASCTFVTVGTSSGSQTAGLVFGIYARGTGTNSSRLESVAQTGFSWQVSANNSSYTINQVTATSYSGYGATGSTSSAGVNITSGYTGLKKIQFPVNTLLSPGNYYFALIGTNITSSISCGIGLSLVGMIGLPATDVGAPMGSFSSAYTGNSNSFGGRFDMIQGNMDAGSAQSTLKATVAISGIGVVANAGNTMPHMLFWST